MGKLFGKASRRTFIETALRNLITKRNSPKVKSNLYLKNIR